MNSRPVVAMALGGVGGFNDHDAGVLSAAHDCGLAPDIITCTSGAIFWTHLYLTDPGSIRAEVERQAAAVNGATALQIAVLGTSCVTTPRATSKPAEGSAATQPTLRDSTRVTAGSWCRPGR